MISGSDAFKLYDTYGYPIELTEECANEAGFIVDNEGFKKYMEVQKEQAEKEKFNELRCYSGHWETSEIQDILRKYEYLSRFVCTVCGLPAEYETQGYIASYCDKCLDKIKTIDRIVPIEFTDTFETVRYSKEGDITTIHDVSKEWERYKESLWVEE